MHALGPLGLHACGRDAVAEQSGVLGGDLAGEQVGLLACSFVGRVLAGLVEKGGVEGDAEVQHALLDAARGRVGAGTGARRVDALVLAALVVPHGGVEAGAGEGVLERRRPVPRDDPAGQDLVVSIGLGACAVGPGLHGERGRSPGVLALAGDLPPPVVRLALQQHGAAGACRVESGDDLPGGGAGGRRRAGLHDRRQRDQRAAADDPSSPRDERESDCGGGARRERQRGRVRAESRVMRSTSPGRRGKLVAQ